MRFFTLPILLALTQAAMAPVIRQAIDWLRASLGGDYVRVLTWLLGLAAGSLLVLGLARINERRLIRRGAVILAGVMLVAAVLFFIDRGSPAQAAVERAHYLLYALLALLFYRAFVRSGHGAASPVLALAAVSCAGLLDEGVQWWVANRTGELFDVLINSYAGLAGVVSGLGLLPIRNGPQRSTRAVRRRLSLLLACVILGLALFIDAAHLGHEIEHPEIGSFASLYSEERLLELNQLRALRPRVKPEGWWARTFQKEDRFRHEAYLHTRRRNTALAADNLSIAWRENLVLEHYYPAYRQARTQGFRAKIAQLSEAQRARMEKAIAADREFRSEADGGLYWTRPSRRSFWLLTVILAAASASLALLRPRPTTRPPGKKPAGDTGRCRPR